MSKEIEMQVFVAIVDTGNFINAANKLSLSKSAISRFLNSLEQRLGVRLLQRTTRKMTLTNEGQTFYLRAKEILALISESESELHPTQSEPVGLVRINVPVSFGIDHLAPLWAKFMERYPQVKLSVTLNDRVVDLLDEGFDLAVRIAQLPNSSLISRKLASTKVCVCASPEYLAKHGTPEHPSELSKHQIIAYNHIGVDNDLNFIGKEGSVNVRCQAALHTNNGDTCRMIALHHGGIILQPDFLIGEDLKQGTLVEVLTEYHHKTLDIYAIYPSRKLLPLRVRCLIDFLIEEFKKPSWSAHQ
ncbi:LysR family transcriptional regulator [Zophobihabitans entericus]|uniref:LysR family transcriptional regulator n=1 Tax=Zophobihabitans entericus TaxID=1635327 RepID=A0A6G9IDA6_9GAMM|nr:LysR family transcriptional regulator [Zophobihabitans entericus]QIQ22218.1 LysR family transcriptional regulator [Zophobihabitans entericus]